MLAALLIAVAPAGLAQPVPNGGKGPGPVTPKLPPPVQFAVFSDPHLYNVRLGDTGSAFEQYLNHDPKLLRESEAILGSAIDSIIQQNVRFVIIPGDLTKDGEIADHVLMAQHLAKLDQHGIQVYVVPGNHDINNPDALAFKGDTTRPVPTASQQTFRALYERFGYGQAIDRDKNSLSYVAEPVKGLWLLAIDSTDSARNQELGYPRVGGRLSPETLSWILAKLQQAHEKGKQVIAFMHHGVNPNSLAQPILFPEYLVDDWPEVSAQLNAAGLKVIFTGHYHSQDAAYPLDATLSPVIGGLCDIETSSLSAYPCAYRFATIEPDSTLNIESRRVTDINADFGGLDFQDYAFADLAARLPALAASQLETDFGVSAQQAAYLAPFVADALIAGYAGDEQPDAQTQAMLAGFLGSPEPLHSLGLLLGAMWTDLPPGDNSLVVPLSN